MTPSIFGVSYRNHGEVQNYRGCADDIDVMMQWVSWDADVPRQRRLLETVLCFYLVAAAPVRWQVALCVTEYSNICTAHHCEAPLTRYHFPAYAVMRVCLSVCVCVCLCVCLFVCVCVSVTFVHHVQTNKDIFEFVPPSRSHTILVFFHTKGGGDMPTGTPLTGRRMLVGWAEIAILSLYLALAPAVNTATCYCEHGRRWSTATVSQVMQPWSLSTIMLLWHSFLLLLLLLLSLVVSGGVDCGKRRRNVYDKKPQRYAKDNRTAHVTVCSDKSVAYVVRN